MSESDHKGHPGQKTNHPLKNIFNRPGGGIGRHKGLKIPRLNRRAGSTPAPGTILNCFNLKYGR